MDALTKEYLISFYSSSLLLHGDRPEALRWTPDGQRLRYSLLLEVRGSLRGRKILDYGCGKGDFYGFLKGKGINVNYTGLDINPDLIELARKKYPECTFGVFDIEEDALDEDFDYIFLCGVFNNKVDGAADTAKNALRRLFRHAKKGLAFNALSSRASEKDTDLNYISPEEMYDFARKELTENIVLVEDRIPNDFTMFLYKHKRQSYGSKT